MWLARLEVLLVLLLLDHAKELRRTGDVARWPIVRASGDVLGWVRGDPGMLLDLPGAD